MRRIWAPVLALAAGGAVAGFATASTGPRPAPSITLSKPLPSTIRQTDTLLVSGRVSGAGLATRAALQVKRSTWSVAATAGVSKHRFTISWHVSTSENPGPVSLRVIARNHHGVVARTKAVQAGIGSAPVYCAPPTPPAVDIPAGDGWIVGGRYIEGGPFPGLYQCDSQQYTVTATDAGGVVQSTQTVAGGHSYTLVVPAGGYTLTSDFCRGTATVTAGQQSQADTVCPVP